MGGTVNRAARIECWGLDSGRIAMFPSKLGSEDTLLRL